MKSLGMLVKQNRAYAAVINKNIGYLRRSIKQI